MLIIALLALIGGCFNKKSFGEKGIEINISVSEKCKIEINKFNECIIKAFKKRSCWSLIFSQNQLESDLKSCENNIKDMSSQCDAEESSALQTALQEKMKEEITAYCFS